MAANQLDANGNPVDPGGQGQAADPAKVRAAYLKYLGRDLSNPGEATGWLNDSNYEQDIANSAEGQAYKTKGSSQSAPNDNTSATAPMTPPAPAAGLAAAPAPTTAAPAAASPEAVRAAYMKFLGRDLSNPGEATGWLADPNFEKDIANSAEGQAYAAQGTGTAAAPGTVSSPFQSALDPNAAGSFAKTAPPADVAQKISDIISKNNLVGSQTDLTSLNKIVTDLRAQGVDAQMAGTDSNGHNAGIVINGKTYQLLNGSNGWTPLQAFSDGSSDVPKSAGTTGIPGPTINEPYTPVTPTTGTPPTDPVGAATQAAILKQLGVLQTPTDANSQTVRDITDPYHLASQRGLEDTRRALAEQAYANGNLNTGGYGQSQIKAVENAGANEANFTGQTVATQEAQRQSMLMNMLGLGQNASQFSQTLSATQKNFADQLAQQDRQFAATLAANVKQFGATIGYQYALLDWSKTQAGINGATTPASV